MKQRIEYIDIAKGFAIICVVIGHVLYFDLYGMNDVRYSKLSNFIVTFQMPLFIFLSGLVSKVDIRWIDMPKDLFKRFRSLVVPMLIIGGVYSLTLHGNMDFLFSNMKWGYWYLWVLFVLYCLSYPISKMGNGLYMSLCQIIVSLLVWTFLIKFPKYLPEVVNDTLSIYQISLYYPYFIIARLVKQNNLHNLLFDNTFIFLISIAFWMWTGSYHFQFSKYITGLAAIVTVIHICRIIASSESLIVRKQKELLKYVGNASLYIYVFHFFFIQMFVTSYFVNFLPVYSNAFWDLILCIIPTLIAILCSLGLKFIIEREPIIMNLVFNKK